jgi:hypothetical protein
MTQNAGNPRDAHEPNAVDAAVAVVITGAMQVPVAVIVHAAGNPIALHDWNIDAFVAKPVDAVVTASAMVVVFVHVNVAVPARYVHVPVMPPSEQAIPGDLLVKVVIMIGATHVPPEGENTHAAGNSGNVHAVPARLSALDAVRD